MTSGKGTNGDPRGENGHRADSQGDDPETTNGQQDAAVELQGEHDDSPEPDLFRDAALIGIKRALQEQVDNPDSGYRPDDIYPPGLDAGSPVYRDPAIWSADWRSTLRPGDPDYVADPDELITHQDKAYRDALKFMGQMERR